MGLTNKSPFQKKRPTPTTGTFTDSRDGQIYPWVRLKDGKKWMTQNLNYQMSDGLCYDNDHRNCSKFGRLYTWRIAKSVCPNGWRLPTDNDWREMTKQYGGSDIDADDGGQASYAALINAGNSQFSAQLGGYRYSDEVFYDLDIRGYYWSSTQRGASFAWYYRFNQYYEKLYRSTGSKSWACSCRCLQD